MELKALFRLGWSVTALAREYGLSGTSVYKELASCGPRSYGRAKPTELNEAQRIHIERRLSVCPGIRGTDLHAELRYEYSYAGSYPAFQRHLRLLRPAEVKDPEIRFETGPGLQTQADWAKLGLFPLGEQMVELSAMVAILGFSRAQGPSTPFCSIVDGLPADGWPVLLRGVAAERDCRARTTRFDGRPGAGGHPMAGTSLWRPPGRDIAMGGWRMAMRVRTIMSQQVITVAVTESVREAARRMRSNGISALPVVKGGELVGIISERDLVEALIDGSNPSTALISRYMTADPQYAGPEDDSSEVALRLLDMGVRHLPVVEAGQVIGMVSARDLLLLEVSPKRDSPPPGSGPSPAAGPAL